MKLRGMTPDGRWALNECLIKYYFLKLFKVTDNSLEIKEKPNNIWLSNDLDFILTFLSLRLVVLIMFNPHLHCKDLKSLDWKNANATAMLTRGFTKVICEHCLHTDCNFRSDSGMLMSELQVKVFGVFCFFKANCLKSKDRGHILCCKVGQTGPVMHGL